MASAQAYNLPTLRDDGVAWLSWNQHAPVYLAGPMADMPEHNFPAFHQAEAKLWEAGAIPMSPARGAPPLDIIDTHTELHDGDFRRSNLYAAMMRRDFLYVVQARAVFFLPGWEKSTGATAECRLADIIGNQLFDGAFLLS